MWARYEAALAEVDRLAAMMERSKRWEWVPLAPVGSFARRMQDGYRALIQQHLDLGARYFNLFAGASNASQDDGTIERLRKALTK